MFPQNKSVCLCHFPLNPMETSVGHMLCLLLTLARLCSRWPCGKSQSQVLGACAQALGVAGMRKQRAKRQVRHWLHLEPLARLFRNEAFWRSLPTDIFPGRSRTNQKQTTSHAHSILCICSICYLHHSQITGSQLNKRSKCSKGNLLFGSRTRFTGTQKQKKKKMKAESDAFCLKQRCFCFKQQPSVLHSFRIQNVNVIPLVLSISTTLVIQKILMNADIYSSNWLRNYSMYCKIAICKFSYVTTWPISASTVLHSLVIKHYKSSIWLWKHPTTCGLVKTITEAETTSISREKPV